MLIKCRKTFIVINPGFFVIVLIVIIMKRLDTFLICLVMLILHEMGHIITALILKQKISIFTVLPFGFSCRFKNQSRIRRRDFLKILIAGPLVNFILAGVLFLWTKELSMISLITGLFNLLPIGELDGMRLLCIWRSVMADKSYLNGSPRSKL